ESELALDLIAHRAGEADAGRSSDLLQAGGNIDAIAQQIAALSDHVAEIDADAEFHPPPRSQVGIVALERPLNGDRGAHGLHGTRELRHHAVAGRCEDPSSMLLNEIANCATVGAEGA